VKEKIREAGREGDTRLETRGGPHLRDAGSQTAPSHPPPLRSGTLPHCVEEGRRGDVLASPRREKPRGSSAFASPSRGSQSKRLAPFQHTSDSGLTLRLRCRLGSSVLRFYPSLGGRCRSMRHPKVPYGRRPTLRQHGVTRRDLGGPDGHWHLSPRSEAPIRGADRGRSTRRSVRSFASEVSPRSAGGPESPSSESLARPKPFERVGRYGRPADNVNQIG
jgi:hypothetical protein